MPELVVTTDDAIQAASKIVARSRHVADGDLVKRSAKALALIGVRAESKTV